MADYDHPLPAISVSRTSTESRRSKASSKNNFDPKTQSQYKSSRPSNPPRNSSKRTNKSFAHWKFGKKADTWKRTHETDPEWKIEWTPECFPHGRVLVIDYIGHERATTPDGKRHVRIHAQEFQALAQLQHFYASPPPPPQQRRDGNALRVIHVQNAPWATRFLLHKFNVEHPNEMVGMKGFATWARYEKPRQRNGKPVPNGRAWRGQTDPWRNVSRTAFGMDYIRPYETPAPNRRGSLRGPWVGAGGELPGAKVLHLNSYDDSHSPHGYDVSVQRISVYIQRSLGPASLHPSPDVNVRNPYIKDLNHDEKGTAETEAEAEDDDTNPEGMLRYFDNGNTVIVFENSASALLEDCLIQPRQDVENRWRRLAFDLRKDDVSNDSRLAAQCTNIILTDIFHNLRETWDYFLACAANHVGLLEDKIYENPADESRAPELWMNQAAWLKVDKFLWIQTDLIREVQAHMRELAEVDDENMGVDVDWLRNTPTEYERLVHNVNEDLIQPTNNLSDLMYKSVGIRDSRQSLQLSLSMWRLSWITFIFLPLSFITSVFGMNVDIFENFPSVGWYFLTASVLMIFVLILWYAVKHSLQRARQTPFQRGLYETLFTHLEETYPQLWTSTGAAADIEPQSLVDRVKWRLLKRWFAPDKTINKKLYSSLVPEGDSAELGAWDSIKRALLLRWLPQISPDRTGDPLTLNELGGTSSENMMRYQASTISALAKASTPLAVAEAEPDAVQPLAVYGLRPLSLNIRSTRNSEDRPSSRGSSGMMVEERNLSDSESDVGGDSSDQHSQSQGKHGGSLS